MISRRTGCSAGRTCRRAASRRPPTPWHVPALYRAENRLMPEPSPYVGSAACASCHGPENRTYRATRHTRSFHHGPACSTCPCPTGPLADPDDPKVTHTIARKDQKIEVHTRAADRVFQMVVAYAFGTSERYVTMIGRDEEKDYRALRLSHYQTRRRLRLGPDLGRRRPLRISRTSAGRKSTSATGSSGACTATRPGLATSATRRRKEGRVRRPPTPGSVASGVTARAGTTSRPSNTTSRTGRS